MNNLAFELKSYEEDVIFIQNNRDNLRKNYLNRFVAIRNGQIVASGISMNEVIIELEKKRINPSITAIEYIPEKESVIIL